MELGTIGLGRISATRLSRGDHAVKKE